MPFTDPEYSAHVAERSALGIPPQALTAEQTKSLCQQLTTSQTDSELLTLLRERVSPGVSAAAKVKADFLLQVITGEATVPGLSPLEAINILGDMAGGYNTQILAEVIAKYADSSEYSNLAKAAGGVLGGLPLASDQFDNILTLAKQGNNAAREVLRLWASASWFSRQLALPERYKLTVFRVAGEINTDDFSPAKQAPTRPDIPLHATYMGETRFPGGIDTIREWRNAGKKVAFVADTVGTGSSRKSAVNSLIWHIGDDIPGVPNKRRGGVVIGTQIAPIFYNTLEDSGALPIVCDASKFSNGQEIIIQISRGQSSGEIRDAISGDILVNFTLSPANLLDEIRAGGRPLYILGKKLTEKARQAFTEIEANPPQWEAIGTSPEPKAESKNDCQRPYTLAQKLVGRACGVDGIWPGTAVEAKISTVGSQDTTGPMTRDELIELACLKFQAPLVLQSFCHTAAYPNEIDKKMHASLPQFMIERGGVALKPGDGVIHSWLNRLLLPDQVGTGGDSHTRFPLGISFPAGSGLVAFAAASGIMPLDMPESVLVKITGERQPGITWRDVINYCPLYGIEMGLIDRPGTGSGKNIFNGRIQEFQGAENLTVEEAFELTCASAERSAAAATVELEFDEVKRYVQSCAALIKQLIADNYQDVTALQKRLDAMQNWLANPELLKADVNANYAAVLELDLNAISAPVLACPNNPDQVRFLHEVENTAIDEVFIGSCMTHIGHFRAAAALLTGQDKLAVKTLWITPPTRMDLEQLESEGVLELFRRLGARIEIPGCSLCMGNQARVSDQATVISTSTRNFDQRLGKDAQVFLGSAEIAAISALLGRLPTVGEYFEYWKQSNSGDQRQKQMSQPLRFTDK